MGKYLRSEKFKFFLKFSGSVFYREFRELICFFLRQLEHVIWCASSGEYGHFRRNYFYVLDGISKKYEQGNVKDTEYYQKSQKNIFFKILCDSFYRLH